MKSERARVLSVAVGVIQHLDMNMLQGKTTSQHHGITILVCAHINKHEHEHDAGKHEHEHDADARGRGRVGCLGAS